MAKGLGLRLGRLRDRRALDRWSGLAERAGSEDTATLRALRGEAAGLRRRLDGALRALDAELAQRRGGAAAIARPMGADWAWRPAPWRLPLPRPGLAEVPSNTPLGGEATLFHDCRVSEILLRQLADPAGANGAAAAPFGLRIEVFRFDGSFLSLALDLPEEGCRGLSLRHILTAELDLASEKPLEVFARLNIRHGPNTEQLVREMPSGTPGPRRAEFDLAYSQVNEKRIERMWLDLIFEGPEMNQIDLADLTLTRRPRAEL